MKWLHNEITVIMIMSSVTIILEYQWNEEESIRNDCRSFYPRDGNAVMYE